VGCYRDAVRWATFVVALAVVAACNDLRDFRGTWQGPRVGDTPVLRVGAPASGNASLSIEELDTATYDAPMSGGQMFEATAAVVLPPGLSIETVRDQLEALADRLMVGLDLTD